METILFFDDQRLQVRENAVLMQGVPALVPNSAYADPADSLVHMAWGYPCVAYEPSLGKWLLFYQGWPLDHARLPGVLPLMAQSEDGTVWTPAFPHQAGETEQWLLANQYLPFFQDGATINEAQVYVDPYAPAEERYKALTLYKQGDFRFSAFLFVSGTGLAWRKKEGVFWHEGEDAPDYPVGVFNNPLRKSYVISARPSHCDRRIAMRETRDWATFTAPELALEPDWADKPVCDLYGMPVIPYHGHYVGFLEIYEPVPYASYRGERPSGLATHKFLDGRVSCQLAFSRNGWAFQRFMRQPFIRQDDPEGLDAGCVYPCCMAEGEKDLRIYASTSRLEHGRIQSGCGSVVMYRLRKDGFAYLDAQRGYAFIRTKGLFFRGGEMTLNVCATDGICRVQYCSPDGIPLPGFAFSDCEPLSGDEVAWRPTYSSGRTPGELAGQVVVIDVEFRHAQLYAVRGDFSVLNPYQVNYFLRYGRLPPLREGM